MAAVAVVIETIHPTMASVVIVVAAVGAETSCSFESVLGRRTDC